MSDVKMATTTVRSTRGKRWWLVTGMRLWCVLHRFDECTAK